MSDSGFRGKPILAIEPPSLAEIDTYTVQFLWVVLRSCQSPAVRISLANKDWVSLLLNMASPCASKLRQLLSLRILRFLLPLLEPSEVRAWNLQTVSSSDVIQNLLESFVDRIGRAFLLSKTIDTEEKEEKVETEDWEAKTHASVNAQRERNSAPDTDVSIASELVSLSRVLVSSPRWSAAINAVVLPRVLAIVNVPDQIAEVAI